MSLNNHYYYQQTRKYISSFGSVFNDMTLVKYNKAHTTELERIKVPIIHSPKESYLYALLQDPDKNKEIQATLPAMSYEMTNIAYDNSRKQNALIQHANRITNVASYAQYMGVPYDLSFSLNIYARHHDDALQILEQIWPIFQPDFNISVNFQSELGFIRDIPIILNGSTQQVDYEGDFSKTRVIVWTLDFTMKVHYYGLMDSAKIIRKAWANTYLDPSLSTGYIMRLNLGSGNGVYKMEDVVYQGGSLNEATAGGIVIDFDQTNSILRIGGVQGTFTVNNVIHGASTNAAYTLASIDMSPLKIVAQSVAIDPPTANRSDVHGYVETLSEFPDTLE